MKTYPKNDKAIYLERVRAHREADELIQSTGWEDGKGCSVGCTIHAYDHSRYSELLGVPEWLARLQDAIFEGLLCERALAWPERFLAAIPEGVDLQPVWPRFAVRLLTRAKTRIGDADETWRVQCAAAVNGVVHLYRAGWPGQEAAEAAEAARAAARVAWAAEAARAAARVAWAAEAARAAARVAWAAEAASWAAEAARAAARVAWAAEAARPAEAARAAARVALAAAEAARAVEWSTQADDLIELIETCGNEPA